MWMPDMNFPLDIVWLNEKFVVVNVNHAVQPCLNRSECPNYSSGVPVRYAIEVNAGATDRLGLRTGVRVNVV
jgi:uncharacterized membrane protein (UPF0127 family)